MTQQIGNVHRVPESSKWEGSKQKEPQMEGSVCVCVCRQLAKLNCAQSDTCTKILKEERAKPETRKAVQGRENSSCVCSACSPECM